MLLFITGLPIVLYGGGISREPYFWLGATLTVLAVALYSKGYIPQSLGVFLAGGTLLLAIRSDLGLAIVWAVLGAVALFHLVSGMQEKNVRTVLQSMVALAILLLSGPSLLDTVRSDWTPQQIEGAAMDLSRPEVNTAIERREVTKPDTWCESGVPEKLICEVHNNLPAVLVGPFPGEIFSGPAFIAISLGTGHFLLVGSLALLAFRWVPPESHIVFAVLTVTGAATLFIIAALLTNYGIIMRFRAISEIFFFPLALLALENLFRRRRRNFQAISST
jgi:hypothetical protein